MAFELLTTSSFLSLSPSLSSNRIERHWRDLVFCLTLLQYGEKTILKLYENMICFADKLTCDRVYEGIKSIIAASRKIAGLKPETRQSIDEFEMKVEECRNKGIEENAEESDLQRQVGLTPPKAGPSSRRTPAKSAAKSSSKPSRSGRKTPARRRVIREDSEDEDDEQVERTRSRKRPINGPDSQPPPPTRRSARERKAQIQQIMEESDDEDSD